MLYITIRYIYRKIYIINQTNIHIFIEIGFQQMIKKLGIVNLLILILLLAIIIIAEWLFLTGHKLHGIFIGLWAPTLLGIVIYLKLIKNERR